ncbi:hypothetical protein ASPACDRAFT_52729 [Aspergillus aculeatus ATCC 16872]|uniref:Protein kinase domain-containing protein n=1 Tax=Aspergillus aculeatus (strain ATCC 16872 / CBS 172.66 / WB 5094) TaxID=690307 RepID=A0A1L9WT10_ASPA1|nr:uncharacterized protein ASPACDRAFT_52729 [Aspergillus aculeatus ATCC 16872]OJJ99330.1 hypothetical protein ASPACDRAFT_52729 [Aspergillus aculeatus ATCC 16872]
MEAEERRKLAEEKRKQAEEERDLEREQTRPTSFGELIRYCHDFFLQRLKIEAPSQSTTGKMPPPMGKCCPSRFRPWVDCIAIQGQIYRSPRLFLKALGDEFSEGPISSEQDFEIYERFCVGNHVRDIIKKLHTIDAARDELRLGEGVQFDRYANALDTDEEDKHGKDKTTSSRRLRNSNKTAWLTGSAVVQEYHVHDPGSTLYYHLCEPNMEVNHWKDENLLQQPVTSVARVLCLCLMSFQSRYRDQEWRNAARAHLPEWKTSFDHTRSQISASELHHNPPGLGYTASEYTGSEPTRPNIFLIIATRSRRSCAPSNPMFNPEDAGFSSDSEADDAMEGRKPSPSVQPPARHTGSRHGPGDRCQKNTRPFCTQRCLLGLQQGGELDLRCPNVGLHRKGGNSQFHLIKTETMVKQIKQQLYGNIDHGCAPIGHRVVGKGITRPLWHQVSCEAEIYGILSRVQGSAVPEMAVAREISRSTRAIRLSGILHNDLRPDNTL